MHRLTLTNKQKKIKGKGSLSMHNIIMHFQKSFDQNDYCKVYETESRGYI